MRSLIVGSENVSAEGLEEEGQEDLTMKKTRKPKRLQIRDKKGGKMTKKGCAKGGFGNLAREYIQRERL